MWGGGGGGGEGGGWGSVFSGKYYIKFLLFLYRRCDFNEYPQCMCYGELTKTIPELVSLNIPPQVFWYPNIYVKNDMFHT